MRPRRLVLSVLLSLLAAAALSVPLAFADDVSTPADDGSQLLDVSKQVNGIERKLNELMAHGKAAKTGELLASAECGYTEPSPVFLAWGDNASYALAPQGNFSASTQWSLNKHAVILPEADPYSGAQQALQFEKSGEAATPPMCVNLDNPTIRFFTRDLGGNGKSNLKLDVLYEDLDGHVKHLTIAKIKATSTWQPSIIVPIYMNMIASATPDGVTAVAFQFKAEGVQKGETLSISSLYVDPFRSR
jgi:hypothetical protein